MKLKASAMVTTSWKLAVAGGCDKKLSRHAEFISASHRTFTHAYFTPSFLMAYFSIAYFYDGVPKQIRHDIDG